MKNIIINKQQEQLLAEMVQRDYTYGKISDKIKNDIDSDKTPLSDLQLPHDYNKKILGKLLTDGYFAAKNNFSDDIESFPVEQVINKANKLIAICKKKEEKLHNELEKLCVDIAVSYFNIDELSDVTLECRLVDDLSQDDFHLQPNTISDFTNYQSVLNVNNRKIANTLVMGGALSLYDKLQEKFIPELFKLDEDLPHLYSKILKINEYLNYISDVEITDRDNHQAGCVKVTIDEKSGNEIVAVGIIFPFMLIETLRGYLELLSDKMLPTTISEAEAITDVADVLTDEPWYMMLGKQLWKRVVGDNDDDITIINELFNCDDGEFNRICTNVLIGSDSAKELIDDLVSNARYKRDYSDFEKDLQKKRDEQELIVDDIE